jgi:hypothetical protein
LSFDLYSVGVTKNPTKLTNKQNKEKTDIKNVSFDMPANITLICLAKSLKS